MVVRLLLITLLTRASGASKPQQLRAYGEIGGSGGVGVYSEPDLVLLSNESDHHAAPRGVLDISDSKNLSVFQTGENLIQSIRL